MTFWDNFADGEKIGLDTSVFVYYINRQEPYFQHCRQIMRGIESGRLRGVISTVSEMEMLVEPLARKRRQLVNDIEDLLRRLTGLGVMPVDGTLARRAAEIRSETRLRSLDALVAATALVAGCRYLVGNDREFARRVKGIAYLVLRDYI
jgi:predicted nucleic acid-binding protein